MSQTGFSVVQVSDLHLDSRDHRDAAWMRKVGQTLGELHPDIVVVTGDLTHRGLTAPTEFDHYRQLESQWPVSPHLLPGNHDIGNRLDGDKVDAERLARWRSVFGDDKFSLSRCGWRLLGINSEIIGSGLADEVRQRVWVEQQLAQAMSQSEKVAVFLHGPPFLHSPDEQFNDHSDYWAPPFQARQWLLKQIQLPIVKLIAHGHTHWHYQRQFGDAQWVWCPSIRGVVDDAKFPPGGEHIGVMHYTFTPTDVETKFVDFGQPESWYGFGRPRVEIPGQSPITVGHIVLDFSGTLSCEGRLLTGVAERLRRLSRVARMTVLTADTHGKAEQALAGLPVQFQKIAIGADKRAIVEKMGADQVVAIGNGRNDVEMFKAAALGIAVIGQEGAAAALLAEADVVVNNILDAFDMLLETRRLTATLRE
ncbi:MAG: metallophosphoesterase [Phycisphaeraceae bacterium]|nr:metallophosphoesterase [Phycisphaeraceae bacterium]